MKITWSLSRLFRPLATVWSSRCTSREQFSSRACLFFRQSTKTGCTGFVPRSQTFSLRGQCFCGLVAILTSVEWDLFASEERPVTWSWAGWRDPAGGPTSPCAARPATCRGSGGVAQKVRIPCLHLQTVGRLLGRLLRDCNLIPRDLKHKWTSVKLMSGYKR